MSCSSKFVFARTHNSSKNISALLLFFLLDADAVKRGPMSKKCRFKDVVRDHPNTLMNMMSQVMGASMNGTSLERDTELSLYLLAYCKTINEVTKGEYLCFIFGVLLQSSVGLHRI